MRKLLFITITLVTIFVSCRKTTTPTNPTNTIQPPTDSVFEGQMGVFNLGTGNTFATTSDTASWHYIAVTKGANLAGQIYLDGQLVADTLFQNKVYNYSTIYLAASNYTSFTGFYNGYLDEFRVSNTVRTAQEIQAYYASNAPFTSDSNTIGLWHFDETNGSTTFANVTGSNGTLTNNPQFVSGKFGNAVYFNGTNQYGNCNLSIPSSNITLEFWYKTSVPQATTLVQPYGYNSTNIYYTTKKVAQQNAPTTLSNGLVAYYPFSGNADDSSGNGYNGTVNGATLTTDRFGNANNAYSFNANPQNITISSLHENNILSYSVAGWFQKNINSANTDGTIFCGDDPLNPPGGLRFAVGSTNQAFWISEFQQASENGVITTNQNYADGKWHSFAGIFSAQAGIMNPNYFSIYIDGILVSQTQESQGTLSNVVAPINNGTLPTIIGNIQTSGDYFQGKIDDIRVYNRLLNQQEITYLATH